MADQDAPRRRGRGRPRDPETDSKITRAAAELLLLRGFDKTTVDEVAARAGVGKATVYRRWPSKEDLAVAAMETLYSAEFPEPDTGSIRGDLAASYRSFIAFANTDTGKAYMRMSITESLRDERIAALYRAASSRPAAHSSAPSSVVRSGRTPTSTRRCSTSAASSSPGSSSGGRCRSSRTWTTSWSSRCAASRRSPGALRFGPQPQGSGGGACGS